MPTTKVLAKKRRHHRIKTKVKGSTKKPRLIVFRSLNSTYAQLRDDEKHVTIASFSDKNLKDKKGTKLERAQKVGESIAKIAMDKKIKEIVFDRGGYKYHGRVKALADGARKTGLKF